MTTTSFRERLCRTGLRAAVLTLLLAASALAQAWKPAPVTLKTQWGEKVTPANAWRDYPRPQFVRERWDEIVRVRKQLDANGGAAHEDRWIEGDTL